MQILREDHLGPYVKGPSALYRPAAGVRKSLMHFGLEAEDSPLLQAYLPRLTEETAYQSDELVAVGSFQDSPLLAVGEELWLLDPLSPTTEEGWARLPEVVAHLRVGRRLRLGQLPPGVDRAGALTTELFTLDVSSSFPWPTVAEARERLSARSGSVVEELDSLVREGRAAKEGGVYYVGSAQRGKRRRR